MVQVLQEWGFMDLSSSEATRPLLEFTLLLCVLLWIQSDVLKSVL